MVLPEDRAAVWIPRPEAAAIRRVPERTVLPSSDPQAIARVLDRTWPGLRRARLGGWVLRDGRGVTRRANSVLVVGDPEHEFAVARQLADQWYGWPARLQIIRGSHQEATAIAAGLVGTTPTTVLVRSAPQKAGAAQGDQTPDEAWLRVANASPERIAEMTACPAQYVRIDDVAIGRVAVNAGWAVLSCVEVDAQARHQGLGRAIVSQLLAEAAALGARHLALQVESANEAARNMYASLGFEHHHDYMYYESA